MLPIFKRKKNHKVIVFYSRPGDLRAAELTQIPLTLQAQNSDLQLQLSCDDTNSVPLFNHSSTVVTNLHLFRDTENHQVWLLAR